MSQKRAIILGSLVILTGLIGSFIRNLEENDFELLKEIFHKGFAGKNINNGANSNQANSGGFGTSQSNQNNKKKKSQKVLGVYIFGEVHKPGYFVIENGKKVYDLLQMSGGVKATANLSRLNLSRKLKDKEKIYIPKRKEKTFLEYIGFGHRKQGDLYIVPQLEIVEEKDEIEGSDNSDIKIIEE